MADIRYTSLHLIAGWGRPEAAKDLPGRGGLFLNMICSFFNPL
ncbi:hypothetical protein [Peribacillus kribbensis]|nr:hypothetical protein [Peribacillus kribbensis]